MTSQITKSISELLGIMADVSSSYAVWRELTDVVNQGQYEETKAQYEDFFITIDRASLAMIVNGLYMLLEGRKDTDNLKRVLERQRLLGRLYEGRVNRWLEEIKRWEPLQQKIVILRSNIFAHRGSKKTSSEFSRHAAITPDELGELIIKVEKLLKDFAEAVLASTAILPFSGNARDSTKELMRVLSEKSA